MAKVCDICGRGPQFGHKISHAHNVSKRRWNLNLQSVHGRHQRGGEARSRLYFLHSKRQGSKSVVSHEESSLANRSANSRSVSCSARKRASGKASMAAP